MSSIDVQEAFVAAKKSEDQFRTIINTIPVLVWATLTGKRYRSLPLATL